MTVQSSPRAGPRLEPRVALGVVAWVGVYLLNERLWGWLAGTVLGLDVTGRWTGAAIFFVYDTVKILLLLTGLIFLVGLLRASLDLDRARAYLEGKGLLPGLVLAAVLGVVTPFCSCSSIPLFIGFVAAGIPLSVTLAFLIASPLVSEVAAIMIGDKFGWHIALSYVLAGMALSMAIGGLVARFPLERWVDPMVFTTRVGLLRAGGRRPSRQERIRAAVEETQEIFLSVWTWVVVGVALGAVIHGWVPTDFFAENAGAGNPFAVVVATLAGVPLYLNGAGVVPIAEALWAKGMALGTVMAFIMSSIALSIPQAVMLRRVLKPPLLAMFFGAVAIGIMLIGYAFNAAFA